MQTNPLCSLVDCFVSNLAGCGVVEIEKSLKAHRLYCFEDAEVGIGEIFSRSGTSAAGSHMSQRLKREEKMATEFIRQYEELIARKIKLLTSSARAFLKDVTLTTSCTKSLDDPQERQFADQADIEDRVRLLSEESVMQLQQQHASTSSSTTSSSSSQPSDAVSYGCFVYVMSRAFCRTALLQWPRETIQVFLNQDSGGVQRVEGSVVAALLERGKMLSNSLFRAADVNHMWSVSWSALTTTFVELIAPKGSSASERENESAQPSENANSSTSSNRIGHYDYYEPVPFPRCMVTTNFPGSITWIAGSALAILEGRADQCAIVHRDDFSTVRHFLPRHRADLTKIAASSIIFALFLDTAITTLVIAEVDMNIYCYDFGPKRRRNLEPWIIMKAPCAMTACFESSDRSSLYVGTRSGDLFVVDPTQVMLDHPRSSPDDEPVRLLLSDMSSMHLGISSQSITGICETSPGMLVVSTLGGMITVLTQSTLTRIRSFEADSTGVKFLRGDRLSEQFLTLSLDGTLTVWLSVHGVNRVTLHDAQVPHLHRIDWLFLDSKFNQAISVDISGLVKMWDLGHLSHIRSLFALSGKPSDEFLAPCKLGDARWHEIPSDIFPLQSFTVDWTRRMIYGRGHKNEFCARFVDGTKRMKAHLGSIRHLTFVGPALVSACGKRICVWDRLNGLRMICEWSSDDLVRIGDSPPLMRHQIKFGVVDGSTIAASTRSELLHQASQGPSNETQTGDETVTSSKVKREVCVVCGAANGTQVMIAYSDGTISCHLLPSGRCTKIFVADRIVRQSRSAQQPRRRGMHGLSASASTADTTGKACGTSLDAMAMCYIEAERLTAVFYADGAIRYFADEGTSRSPIHYQLMTDEVSVAVTSSMESDSTSPNAKLKSTAKMVTALLGLAKSASGSMAASPSSLGEKSDEDILGSSQSSMSGFVGQTTRPITGCIASARLRLFATSFAGGLIRAFDISVHHTSVVKSVHEFQCEGDVTAMTFLGNYPCLAVATSTGQLELFLTRGSSILTLISDVAAEVETDRRRRARSGSIARGHQGNRRRSGSVGRLEQGACSLLKYPVDGPALCLRFLPESDILLCAFPDGRLQSLCLTPAIVLLGICPIPEDCVDPVSHGRDLNKATLRHARMMHLVGVVQAPPDADDLDGLSPTSELSFLSGSRFPSDAGVTPRVEESTRNRIMTPDTPALTHSDLLLCSVLQNAVNFVNGSQPNVTETELLRTTSLLFHRCRATNHDSNEANMLRLNLDASAVELMTGCVHLVSVEKRPLLPELMCEGVSERLLPYFTSNSKSCGSISQAQGIAISCIEVLPSGLLLIGSTSGDFFLAAIAVDGTIGTLNCAVSVADLLLKSCQQFRELPVSSNTNVNVDSWFNCVLRQIAAPHKGETSCVVEQVRSHLNKFVRSLTQEAPSWTSPQVLGITPPTSTLAPSKFQYTRSPRTASFVVHNSSPPVRPPLVEISEYDGWDTHAGDSVMESSSWVRVKEKQEKIRIALPRAPTAQQITTLNPQRPSSSAPAHRRGPPVCRTREMTVVKVGHCQNPLMSLSSSSKQTISIGFGLELPKSATR